MNLLKFITPVNLEAEKDKFFASTRYDPIFEYARNDEEVNRWLNRQPHYRPLAEAILKQDHEAIVRLAQSAFDTLLSDHSLAYAQKITATSPQIDHIEEDVEVLVSAFEAAFEFFGINYKIEVTDKRGFNIRPIHNLNKLVISQHLNLQYFSIEDEVAHEMVHIIRAVNGTHNQISPNPTYLSTEEGLACYFMDFNVDYESSSLFQHAAEYCATQVGLTGSLRDIIDYFVSVGFNSGLAWQRAVRHKCGFVDTRLPGDIMKPGMYFHHEMKIKDLSDFEKLRLLNGKISLDQIENYPEYTGKIAVDKLTDFYNLKIRN